MHRSRIVVASAAALLLGALPLVAAHEDDGMDMDMSGGMNSGSGASSPVDALADQPANYFRHHHHAGWMYAHIALMIVGWAVVLPVSIMLSVARSRYNLPGQIMFHIFNGLGVFSGFVYNHSTPDLYKHNSHHPIGGIVTSFTIIWTITSSVVAYSDFKSRRRAAMSTENMAHHNRFQHYKDDEADRYSRDSGQGTERNSLSLLGSPRQNSQDSLYRNPEEPASPSDGEFEDVDIAEPEKNGLLGHNRVDRFISRNVRRFATPKASKVARFSQIVLEKLLLLLGFLAITSGFVVYGGVFRGRDIFSGLAHFIKGGIFFWYGLLTLGRWMGAFTEFGWAWNIRPDYPMVSRWKSRIPSAEFTESFVIWLYGASNVFLEHLNNWGKAWSHQDFEHVSITLLFFGGGLLGMMIESPKVRELMNTTVEIQKSEESEVGRRAASRFYASDGGDAAEEPDQLWTHPKTYRTSLNPMPGLVIMLLGVMMSAHHQDSMVSTMMHSQWGSLFAVFAMARAVTYITLYLKPPTSHFPARPPSELVAAFCLTAGGLIFMVSARDTVASIEMNGLDAMAIFTVTMGFTGLLLAWEVAVFSIKGWAVRKERAAISRPIA